MSTLLEKLTVSEYLEKERNSNLRAEYIQGEERKLTGASFIHNKMVVNLIRGITSKLNSRKWEI
ncbi:MAG TPA: hypothetical protein PKK94_25790, partial [Leptospiraceae bacterium]|nr:hypothetical protein [Leptospiraceae bacterium]